MQKRAFQGGLQGLVGELRRAAASGSRGAQQLTGRVDDEYLGKILGDPLGQSQRCRIDLREGDLVWPRAAR